VLPRPGLPGSRIFKFLRKVVFPLFLLEGAIMATVLDLIVTLLFYAPLFSNQFGCRPPHVAGELPRGALLSRPVFDSRPDLITFTSPTLLAIDYRHLPFPSLIWGVESLFANPHTLEIGSVDSSDF